MSGKSSMTFTDFSVDSGRHSKMDMQVTGRPVDPDNRRRHLAWRLFAHQVRMGAVHDLTTFTRHQQKTQRERWGFPADTRPRGTPPSAIARFFESESHAE